MECVLSAYGYRVMRVCVCVCVEVRIVMDWLVFVCMQS